jgi:nitrite reductase/ring-hydroxylating ferredoxin subunit
VDLSRGTLTGQTYSSGIGHYGFRDTGDVVRCPRHGYEFDVNNGFSRFSPKTRIRVYPVSVEDGKVLVDN